MTRHRWMKFWPGDWRSDLALRACSPAARGLWIDLLTIMHEAEPYGHLLIGGQSPSPRRLAAVLNMREAQIVSLLDELRSEGVCSETEDGIIYSRRMVRDAQATAEARENGRKGGNPKLTGLKGWVNPPDKPPLKLEAEAEAEREEPLSLPDSPKESLTPHTSPGGDDRGDDLLTAADPPPDMLAEAVDAWNGICGGSGLPRVKTITTKRRKALKRILASQFDNSLERWRAYCRRITRTPFCTGDGERGWLANIDWAVREDSVVRMREDTYRGKVEAA